MLIKTHRYLLSFQAVFTKIHSLNRVHIRQVFVQNPHAVKRLFISSKSSRRVLNAAILTAGKMRLLDKLRSNCNSMLPVPLNSSKITSSILEPVSINAVAKMVSNHRFQCYGQLRRIFGLMQCVGIHTTGILFARCRRNRVVNVPNV